MDIDQRVSACDLPGPRGLPLLGNLPSDLATLEKLPYIEAVRPGDNAVPAEPLRVSLQEQNFDEALTFKPERWLAPAAGCPHNRNAFIPFGAGPQPGAVRNKNGVRHAMPEFHFESAGFRPVGSGLFSFTMMPENLSVTFAPR
jgi:hypothetical protein